MHLVPLFFMLDKLYLISRGCLLGVNNLAYEPWRFISFIGYFLLLLSIFSLAMGARDPASLALLTFSIIISILMIVFSVLVATGRITLLRKNKGRR